MEFWQIEGLEFGFVSIFTKLDAKWQGAVVLFALIEFAAAMISKFHFFQCVEMFLPLSVKAFEQIDVKLKSHAPLW